MCCWRVKKKWITDIFKKWEHAHGWYNTKSKRIHIPYRSRLIVTPLSLRTRVERCEVFVRFVVALVRLEVRSTAITVFSANTGLPFPEDVPTNAACTHRVAPKVNPCRNPNQTINTVDQVVDVVIKAPKWFQKPNQARD